MSHDPVAHKNVVALDQAAVADRTRLNDLIARVEHLERVVAQREATISRLESDVVDLQHRKD